MGVFLARVEVATWDWDQFLSGRSGRQNRFVQKSDGPDRELNLSKMDRDTLGTERRGENV